jgi:hypothetical protein
MHSDASFRAAAKHLFRHLHEARALRKNLLVRQFFANSQAAAPGRSRERVALERIHALVRRGADDCRDADLSSGKGDRGVRQHAIITLQCLERRPIEEVAAQLSISPRHCYRERAEICRRVARYIREKSDAPGLNYLNELDEFRFLMDRALRRAAIGDAKAAFDEYDELIRIAPSAPRKIEALRTSALVSIDFGNIERAENAYALAVALYNEEPPTAAYPLGNVAQACIDLMASKIAYYRANTARALRMAQRAAATLAQVQANAAGYVRELYVESLYELGTAFCNFGNLERGYDCIADAEARMPDVRTASSRLRTRITVAVWKLRNYLLLSSKSWYPSHQRLQGLTMALEQAYASGSIPEATAALDALTEHHSLTGNDDEAWRVAHLAVSIAKQQSSERIQVQLAIRVALKLLTTQYWDEAVGLLPDQGRLEHCDAYHRELASYFAAERALRLHLYADAWKLANEESDRREYAALTVSRRLVAACAAHALERRREARSLIEMTIPAAERLGSAPTLRDAYRAAATVMRDAGFRRRAKEITDLLTA